MPQLLWDASALAKGYAPEVGRATVRALLAAPQSVSMLLSYVNYAETCAVLRRQLNRGVIDFAAFSAARSLLRSDVFLRPNLHIMELDGTVILASIALIDQHNLNATDAAILYAYLDYAQAQAAHAPKSVLITCDVRLIGAATAEGLPTLNPETFPLADVSAFLASA